MKVLDWINYNCSEMSITCVYLVSLHALFFHTHHLLYPTMGAVFSGLFLLYSYQDIKAGRKYGIYNGIALSGVLIFACMAICLVDEHGTIISPWHLFLLTHFVGFITILALRRN